MATDSSESVATASASKTKSGKGKVVRVMYPGDRFIIEDLPVITTEGTELSAEEVKKAAAAAKASGVKLVDEDGNRIDVEDGK